MPRTIGELSVVGEFRKLRERIPAGSREVLEASQSFALRKIQTSKDAIHSLVIRALNVLEALPAESLIPDHPAIGALSTLLAHPDADRSYLRLLKGEHRQRVDDALAKRPLSWSAQQLEWQWCQYVATAGEQVALDPRVPLTQQVFESKPLSLAWDGLLNLEVLWAWGLVT